MSTTTAAGWACIDILAIWAQLESDQISKRVHKAVPVPSANNYHFGAPATRILGESDEDVRADRLGAHH